tara:strand:- start:62 stop:259 length:198 start_codon:yes stop_codon:yes gene_type:complete
MSYGGRGLSNFFIENDHGEESLIRRRRKNYEPGRSSESKTISFGRVEGQQGSEHGRSNESKMSSS